MSTRVVAERPGLYIHVPFCSAICPYCDFAVRVGRPEDPQRFVTALLAEIALYRDLAAAPPFAAGFDTIYLGGGTPSLLTEEQLESLLNALRDLLGADPQAHLTLEANPEDVNRDSLAAWRRLGVSTLSLGVQSFDADELDVLGRRHTPHEARLGVEKALTAGFGAVSVDLIYGLPGQRIDAWRRSLTAIAELGPEHVSCYELEVHPRTTFGKRQARGTLIELEEEAQAELFHLTHRELARAGYAAYEVSNFAKRSVHRSVHNSKYWRHVPYLGLGPSAHSFDGHRRWWNARHLPQWQSKVLARERAIVGEEVLDLQTQALERVMLGLRTVDGVDLERLKLKCGVDLLAHNRQRIASWVEDGLVLSIGKRLVPTSSGLAVADRLAASLDLSSIHTRIG